MYLQCQWIHANHLTPFHLRFNWYLLLLLHLVILIEQYYKIIMLIRIHATVNRRWRWIGARDCWTGSCSVNIHSHEMLFIKTITLSCTYPGPRCRETPGFFLFHLHHWNFFEKCNWVGADRPLGEPHFVNEKSRNSSSHEQPPLDAAKPGQSMEGILLWWEVWCQFCVMFGTFGGILPLVYLWYRDLSNETRCIPNMSAAASRYMIPLLH